MRKEIAVICIILLFLSIMNNCASQQIPTRPPPPDEVKPTPTPDMKNWQVLLLDEEQEIPQNGACILIDNKIHIIGGKYNNITYLDEENGWVTKSVEGDFGNREFHTANYYKNNLYLIMGLNNSKESQVIFYLKDGITWTAISEINIPARYGHSSLVHNNKLFIIAGKNNDGYLNDIWVSEDGFGFKKLEEKEKKFSPRTDSGTVSYNNKIWIIGGEDNEGLKNDVWYSENGVDWEMATENARFSKRSKFSAVAYKNRIWIIGGKTESGAVNDVWWSIDGVNWVSITVKTIFPERFNQYCIEKDGFLWVLGGSNNKGQLNDIWKCQ